MAKRSEYSWSWQSIGDVSVVWHRTLVAALRAQSKFGVVRLCVRWRDRRRAVTVVTPIEAPVVARTLRHFVAGQCGALAIDLGDGSRQGVLLAEQHGTRPGAAFILYGPHRVGVRRARVQGLCALVAMQVNPIRASLLVMRLRSRRKGETSPHRLLEAFLKAEAAFFKAEAFASA